MVLRTPMSSKCWSRKRRPGAAAGAVQHLEEIEVGVEPAGRRQLLADEAQIDAVHVDAAVFARPGAARQRALVDQPPHELDGADIRATSDELNVISLTRFMISCDDVRRRRAQRPD